ncbi:MAG: ATP-dependent DNA helicase [Candidatus Micrarchaeota archaeon]
MAIYFRHEQARPFQRELMDDIYSSLRGRKIFMASAPTGSGKTDSALSAAITHALEEDLTVFFLTPKISQHRIAVDVVRGIAEKHNLKLRAVDMVGRANCCIDDNLGALDNDAFQTLCSKKRKDRQCMYYCNARGYERMGEMKADSLFKTVEGVYGIARTHNDLVKLGRHCSACPYEWLLKLCEDSNVIIADYHHLMNLHIRDVFLSKIKKRIEDSVIIIDEAHNLAQRVRDSLSSKVSTYTFARMEKEMRFLRLDPGPVRAEFDKWGGSMLGKEKEHVLAAKSFELFIERFGLDIEEVAGNLSDAGFKFVEATGRKSACLKLARFFTEWGDPSHDCVRVLRKKGDAYLLSRNLLDPSPATRILNRAAGAVLMSGTLSPLEMHRDILGLDKDRTMMRAYPSPFDKKNVVNIVANNLTTRYSRRDPQEFSAIASKIDAIIEKTPGGTAVFFPSYKMMDNVLPLVQSRGLIIQRSGMRPHETRQLIKDFKSGGVLCGVQGGSLSEGVDYCDGEIKTVVIVGVALDEMGVEIQALIDYYDEKFGRGWDYGYLYPGTIKALQAAGRARRKESDRVAVVYLDERFQWSKYNWILNKSEKIVITGTPEDEVGRFWEDVAHDEIRAEKAR